MNSDNPFIFEATKDTPLGMPTAQAMEKYKQLGYSPEDLYNNFPCFAGAKTLARYLSFFQCYQMTLGLAGHMAEVGVYRGGVSLFLAKLSLLYEPHSMTQVHGFDWFRAPSAQDQEHAPEGHIYYEPFERITQLIGVQGLQRYVLLHRLNVVSELQGFFEQYTHLQFKLVFLDAGEYDIVARSIREFWPRLTNGGVMIFDQFNHEVAPGETHAIKELLPPDAVIRSFPHGGMPTAYVVKGERVSGRSF
ncbi:class I SAM-dependent methyltransferase [Afipia massiliensis]|uniref:Class I SAM-dependent methyltransferase n=1 Tax=Afipia massiliensis TaxID=211460 RepID=A0A4U6BQT5_9BRAD|nr:class I SAM-dependent methyltransferase [Afipia massiliensis]TKT72909.1 class I SAM-dependent methyltransferase [Afipia massiliensis]